MPSVAYGLMNDLVAISSLANTGGSGNSKATIALVAGINQIVPGIRSAAKKEFDPDEFALLDRDLAGLERADVEFQVGRATVAELYVRIQDMRKRYFGLALREAIYPDSPRLRQAYNLFANIFTHGELDDFSVFREACKDALDFSKGNRAHKQVTRLFFAVQHGVVIGAVWGTYLPTSNIGFHWYLAISPEIQSKGTGSLLRERMNESFNEDARRCGHAKAAGFFGEIETTSPWLRKAIQVWRVIPLDIFYESPRVGAVGASAGKYCLYFQPADTSEQCVSSDLLYKMVYDIFKYGYWMAKPEMDMSVKRTLDSIRRKPIICARAV